MAYEDTTWGTAMGGSGSSASSVNPGESGGDTSKLERWINTVNIAEDLDKSLLGEIGVRVWEEYDIDEKSRSEWVEQTRTAMDLAMQIAKEKQFPWPKAANVIYPLMTSAAMQFAARAYPAIVQNRSVVKGIVIGDDSGQVVPGPNGPVVVVPPGVKQSRADRIGAHMSWQLLDEMSEWEPETDTLLHVLPIVGCEFRKTYYDPGHERNFSLRVSALNVVLSYKAKSIESAPRITEVMEFYPFEMEENFRSGLWLRPETPFGIAHEGGIAGAGANYGGGTGTYGDRDAPHVFLEQHRAWDLDDDGYPEPYIVTVHKDSRTVVRIVARYDAAGIYFSRKDDRLVRIKPKHYYTKYDFIPNPDGGIYGIGFGQLLRSLNESINTTLNQMLDAGTLQNAGGGFIGRGLSMNAGAIRFQMGEYKVVNTSGASLKESIVPLNFPGPSQTLFQLLGMLVESGKEVAAIKDILTGEGTSPNTPATTTLAIIEQGLKVFSAIYKRIHRSLKSELAKLYELNRVHGPQEWQFKVGDAWNKISKADYEMGSGVEPISDASMVTDMQRLGKAQFLMQFMMDPLFNPQEIRTRILEAANIEDIGKILLQQALPNAEVAAKAMELEQKGHELAAVTSLKKAQEVLAYSQAINQLAQADKAVGDQHIEWLNQHLRVWEAQMDAALPQGSGENQVPGTPAPPPPDISHPVNPNMAPPNANPGG